MANTIENTTDVELLRSIIDGSITELEDDTITGKLPQYKLRNCTNLEKVILPNVTSVGTFAFANDTSIKKIQIPNVLAIGNSAFHNCSSLKDIDVSGVISLADSQSYLVDSGQCNTIFQGCSSLKKVKFDSLTTFWNGNRQLCTSNCGIEILIYPSITHFYSNMGQGFPLKRLDLGSSIADLDNQNYYVWSENFEALILRSNSVAVLKISKLLGNDRLATDATKGQSGKNSTYKIYVPEALISEYQSATNWSNYSTFFTAIEGTEYEHYWADGTPVYMSNTSGLIAYYDVGNASDWDSETKTIASHVENDFNAWRQTSNNQFNINNAANIPTDIYDNCYMNGGFIINFGDGTTSNVSIGDKYDIITIEFLYASSSNSSINISKASTNESLGTQIIGYIGGLDLTFKHIVLELSKTGTKLFINKVQKININDNNMNRPVINISSSNNCHIGHVSVWNRALTQEEIAEHYQYYVDNFHVGETAFDSNGNFIAGS